MKLAQVLTDIVAPTARVLPSLTFDDRAKVMLLAIGQQESAFEHRVQMGNGPARSFWQFERGGGVKGVLQHPASKVFAAALCRSRDVPATAQEVWARMAADDVLGCGMARLLLLTDPAPLPALTQRDMAWAYYERNWRPGKPHPEKWPAYHALAVAAVLAQRAP